jgi:hypothetical protein
MLVVKIEFGPLIEWVPAGVHRDLLPEACATIPEI